MPYYDDDLLEQAVGPTLWLTHSAPERRTSGRWTPTTAVVRLAGRSIMFLIVGWRNPLTQTHERIARRPNQHNHDHHYYPYNFSYADAHGRASLLSSRRVYVRMESHVCRMFRLCGARSGSAAVEEALATTCFVMCQWAKFDEKKRLYDPASQQLELLLLPPALL